jgi:hypothetical protein
MSMVADGSHLEPASAANPHGSGKLIRFGRWLREEIRKTRPVFIFFLIGFLLVLMIIKLSLAQYSIETRALSNALLGAVLAAKIVLILENTPMAHPFRNSARIFGIACKSLIYGAGVILLAYLERFIDAFRHSRRFGASAMSVMMQSNLHRLLALSLGIAMVFAAYFVLSDLSDSMGNGAMRRFFLERRQPLGEP